MKSNGRAARMAALLGAVAVGGAPVAWGAATAVRVATGATKAEETGPKTAEVTEGAAERYAIRGEVLKVDAAKKVLVVHHEEIPGYMPAMTMEFIVSAGDVAVAKPGQRIRAEMIPSKDGDFRLEKIWPDEKSAAATEVAAVARRLRAETLARGKDAYCEVGEAAPEFALYDQSGEVVRTSRFQGRQLMVNFIFTRCPVATMCPASTAKMMTVQRLAKDAGVADLELVSITLDPVHDTPGVLRDYAATRGIDTGNFSLLTGPESAIKDLLTQFGVIAQFQGDILQHTLVTLLVDGTGKIALRTDGSAWEPKEFVARMKR